MNSVRLCWYIQGEEGRHLRMCFWICILISHFNLFGFRHSVDSFLNLWRNQSLLMRVKENGKSGLKLKIQKTEIMASNRITSSLTDWEKVEAVTDFIFLGSKITADSDCTYEIKRRLLLGRRTMTNLDSILKSGDITLPSKVCILKTMVFLVVLHGCESWTVKKAEHQRIDAFKLCC